MLGRGVKRKRSCLEELEAELLPAAARKPSRKQDVDEDRVEEEAVAAAAAASLLQQRQVVLGLCLKKLQDYQAGVELSLRRSVLLVNTLRQIQEEMRRDRTGSAGDLGEDVSVTCPGCRDAPELPSQDFDGLPPAPAWSAAAANAGGYLSDLAPDDVFEDIDTSMYETSELLSSCGAAALWPPGASPWPEEHLKPPGPAPCLTDLNELDYIIEILVKS